MVASELFIRGLPVEHECNCTLHVTFTSNWYVEHTASGDIQNFWLETSMNVSNPILKLSKVKAIRASYGSEFHHLALHFVEKNFLLPIEDLQYIGLSLEKVSLESHTLHLWTFYSWTQTPWLVRNSKGTMIRWAIGQVMANLHFSPFQHGIADLQHLSSQGEHRKRSYYWTSWLLPVTCPGYWKTSVLPCTFSEGC